MDLPKNRTGSHALQNLENISFLEKCLTNRVYQFSIIIPREIFDKTYPANPWNFGERLRKARMDAGLKIKELAGLIGVTEDTVINWEVRGRRPLRKDIYQKLQAFFREHSSNQPVH
ncbi:MAG: helix-turn-helix transcriptional regulator [Deltaproteobacteria bacterium]|nr:helix-turn-helix transcriptional regulator [Deltaproteobacteria bacterium]MBW1936986.1 helix-turn-helix transcriptional regulator [Deltaproteobacteria bacterium]MBW2301783.1 helix-turn-helix transcriptional regulator [Deltaproteobacteria bacterium]